MTTRAHGEAAAAAKGMRPVTIALACAAMLTAVGLVIYEFFAGTLLENYVAVAATWLTLAVITAVTRRPARYLMWVYAGPLIFSSWQIISTLADERRWPVHHHLIRLGGRFIFVAGIASMAAGAVIGIRSGDLPLLRVARKMIGVQQKDSGAAPPA